MPEIKHTFQTGKMNKDLDERIVPNGEYRDAKNIQVRTSSGDAIGTIQNIKGTAEVGSFYYDSTWMVNNSPPSIVASVADEKSDKVYFFSASPPVEDFITVYGDSHIIQNVSSERIFVDAIAEQDVNGDTNPVAVDVHTIINTYSEVIPDDTTISAPFTSFEVVDASNYRVDMTIKALGPDLNNPGAYVDYFTEYVIEVNGELQVQEGNGAIIKAVDTSTNIITLYEEQTASLKDVEYFLFEAKPVLNFQGNQITGINVIDNLLFWTDNLSEPKKINIDRGKKGSRISTNVVLSSDWRRHTRLHVKHQTLSTSTDDVTLVPVDQVSPGLSSHPTNIDLKEEHLTVLRQAPRSAPTLKMSNTMRFGLVEADFEWAALTPENPTINPDDIVIISNPWGIFQDLSLEAGDTLDIQPNNTDLGWGGFQATFLSFMDYDSDTEAYSEANNTTDYIKIQIVIVGEGIGWYNPEGSWKLKLIQQKPLFELKMCRFGYRYKYEDGEYSAFSPWSELAFLPGEFDLVIKKAYNLGMVNTLRNLVIKDFLPYKKPLDVREIDILFKMANEPNVYIVKTIKRTKDDEWELFSPSFVNPDVIKTGEISITSEMIHRALPSNQILRAWDNVPRYALAQEITANRLLYGNYTQGYPFTFPVNLTQVVNSLPTATLENPTKSVKSIRNYKWGMVFGDTYGRETPVIESGYTSENADSFYTSTGDIIVSKDKASRTNKFELTQSWSSIAAPNGQPPDWADYVKYYVKETSNEYYNMVMDRWYWADEERDNVWISFNSADRNKVDEETYLLLKNQHGNHTAVSDEARFKIIAIENDAPDYIKTDDRILGSVSVTSANTINGEGAQTFFADNSAAIPVTDPIPIMNNTTVQIRFTSWNTSISSWAASDEVQTPIPHYASDDYNDTVWGRRVEGNIKMRIVGKNSNFTLYSEWRTIYHYRFIDSVNPGGADAADYQRMELNWDRVWGEDADMVQKFDDANYGSVDEVLIEFAEAKVNHRPEFDGKFFVKLETNQELKNHVLYSDGSGGVYTATASSFMTHLNGDEVPNLGNCENNVESKNYWNSLFYSFDSSLPTVTNIGHKLFFDNTQPFHANYTYPLTYGGATTTTFVGNDGDNINDIGGALSAGTLTGVGFGRMILSKIIAPSGFGTQVWEDVDNDGYTDGVINPTNLTDTSAAVAGVTEDAAVAILNGLKNVGQKFRFQTDPEQKIYQVVAASEATGDNPSIGYDAFRVHNYGGGQPATSGQTPDDLTLGFVDYVINEGDGTGACIPCGAQSTSTGNGACYKRSIIVDFRLLNEDTNQVFDNQGLITDSFNPLEAAGPGSGISPNDAQIALVSESEIYGGPALKKELGGCWETEPKDDVDLDIYYEASNSIPMKLTPFNSFDFAPINSSITLKRWNEEYLNDVVMTNTNQKVANIEFTNDTSLIYITSENTTGEVESHIYDVAVGDYLCFTHSDGTQTQSEVTGVYTPVPFGSTVTSSTSFIPSTLFYTTATWTIGDDTLTLASDAPDGLAIGWMAVSTGVDAGVMPNGVTVSSVNGNVITTSLEPQAWNYNNLTPVGDTYTINILLSNQSGYYEINSDVWQYPIKLGWFNCYSYGNGVESDRIRDDFNAARMGNGVRVSTTFSGYGEEKKSSGIIYSGLYNSTSEVNDLNEFNMGEKIQKDLNPVYGSIQAMKTRDKNVVVFTEDRVLQVLAGKDALFNADGNPQLTATNRVLGTTIPYAGDYGISQNPESLAWDQYRLYFADRQRGAVLRLSRDGLTPISNVGMKTFFRDNLKKCNNILGTFDTVNGEYNLTLNYRTGEDEYGSDTTVSFNEGSKGWVSFKSFTPQAGNSVSGKYITAKDYRIWEHYRTIDQAEAAVSYNNFYGVQYESSFNVLFNDMPSIVKTFNTISYEGTQSKIIANQNDDEYYNLTEKNGWYVNSFETDMNSGSVPEFINKENKWFNRIHGVATSLTNLDTSEFTVQGLGVPTVVGQELTPVILIVQNDENADSDASVNWNSSSSTDG